MDCNDFVAYGKAKMSREVRVNLLVWSFDCYFLGWVVCLGKNQEYCQGMDPGIKFSWGPLGHGRPRPSGQGHPSKNPLLPTLRPSNGDKAFWPRASTRISAHRISAQKLYLWAGPWERAPYLRSGLNIFWDKIIPSPRENWAGFPSDFPSEG